ncbi:MAG: glycosyltransferase, partial [Candidatus Electrothrix sp. AR4]|nr:glycosyltransferase [Candidatus Electrothrix sp. AR4]
MKSDEVCAVTVPAIIGIVLVKNEDVFIEQILRNIIAFCDEIIVADNLSSDQTASTVQRLQSRFDKIRYRSIKNNPN